MIVSNVIFIAVFFLLSLVVGCKKDENPVDAGSSNPTSNASGQPVPNFAGTQNYGGVLATIQFEFATVPGFPSAAFAMGFAQFGNPSGVDAGTVSVNNNTLGKTAQGSNTFYSSFSQTNPSTLDNVSFNGSAHSWTVGGGNGVSAFTASVTSPSSFSLTQPTANATISKSGGLNVTWSGGSVTSTDSIMVVIAGQGGTAVKQGERNTGSVTFSAGDLASMSGQVILQVVKYRYAISTQGGKSYVLVSEIVKQVTITLN